MTLKNDIIQLLDSNNDRIKGSFKVDDEEIDKIRDFLNKDHRDFRSVIDDMSTSNLSDRGKMITCCLIGYVNGITRSQLFT